MTGTCEMNDMLDIYEKNSILVASKATKSFTFSTCSSFKNSQFFNQSPTFTKTIVNDSHLQKWTF